MVKARKRPRRLKRDATEGTDLRGARCLTKKGRKVMPARASKMHTKSLWARCRIVRHIARGMQRLGVKGRKGEGEEGEERCKERDNNKWLARRRMLDLHEKIDGLEEGDACSVCFWPVGVANPPPSLWIIYFHRLKTCCFCRSAYRRCISAKISRGTTTSEACSSRKLDSRRRMFWEGSLLK